MTEQTFPNVERSHNGNLPVMCRAFVNIYQDEKGVTIQTGFATVDCKKFLEEILPPFEKVMVGVSGGQEPFAHIYFDVSKQDVIDTVRMNQCKVTFAIMFNSKVKEGLADVLYIKKLK